VYYTVRSTKLETWLENESICDSLRPTLDKNYVDLDPTFASSVDEDYDHRLSGVSKNSFTNVYLDWIQCCATHRDKVRRVEFAFCIRLVKYFLHGLSFLHYVRNVNEIYFYVLCKYECKIT